MDSMTKQRKCGVEEEEFAAFVGIFGFPTPHFYFEHEHRARPGLVQDWVRMFKSLFHYPRAFSRHADGPSAEERKASLKHLASRRTPVRLFRGPCR